MSSTLGSFRPERRNSPCRFSASYSDTCQLTENTVLVDDAQHLDAASSRFGLRLQTRRHGNRDAVEHILGKIKRRTFSFSNTFGYVQLRRPNGGCKPSPSGGINIQVNTTTGMNSEHDRRRDVSHR